MLSPEEITAHLLLQRLGLTAYISVITRERALAEELFQEVCAQAMARREGFESVLDLRRWVSLAARNLACERTRNQARGGLGLEVLVALEAQWAESEASTSAEALEALGRCLEELPPSLRALVGGRYFQMRSGAELAQEMGCKTEVVYQSLAKVHGALGECVRKKMAEA